MRKEVEKMKKFGLIGLMLLVILATPAMAAEISTNCTRIGVDYLSTEDKVTYGADIPIKVKAAGLSDDQFSTIGTRTIAIFENTTYYTKVYNATTGDFNITAANKEQLWSRDIGKEGLNTLSDPLKVSTATYKIYAGTYVLVMYNSTVGGIPTACANVLRFVVEPVAGKPYVSISTDRMTAALGDVVKVDFSASGSDIYIVGVLATGWEGKTYFLNCTAGDWTPYPWGTYSGGGVNKYDMGACIDTCVAMDPGNRTKASCEAGLKYFPLNSSKGFKDTTKGIIVFKVVAGKEIYWWNGSDPYRSEAIATVILAKPTLSSISVPSKHVNGTDLTITGVTNVAETRSEYDRGLDNMVYMYITDLSGNLQCGGRTFSAIIGKDRTFSIKIDNFGAQPPCVLETGYYKAEFRLVTDTGFADEDTVVFELVNGMVKISPDKTTVVRGDKVKFTIITNLKVNSPVVFTIEDARIIGGTGSATETLRVDATGKAYKEITVAQTAPLTEYKFKAEIAGNVTDTISISVVKQTIELSADKTTVARGGEIRFTGTTTAERVYIFVNDNSTTPFLFGGKAVPEILDSPITIDDNWMVYAVPDSNDRLDFKIEVNTRADAGTYYLYFYANVTPGTIDRASDPQKMFAIVVTDPRIIKVDIPNVIPYQGEVKVKILTDPGKRENAYVTFVLEGPNVKARPGNFNLNDRLTIDSNNEVNFRLNLKSYYDGKNKALEPGLYVFTVRLYLADEETDKVQKLVEISTLKMDVKIEPETIVVGDQIKVTIETSREGVAGYDHIWVTMVGANYKAIQKVTLDSSGKGSVTFETLGIADGTYKFFVRDTMGTIAQVTENYLAEELYDLDPADTAARTYRAHDDLLVIKTVQILKEKPAVTTPPPTTPPVTTPEVTPTTPPPTPVETTPPPTPTPAPGPIPGFEAIFAIAGLIAVAYLLRKRQ
ncbi:MAG: PGF-CTERM sorting domain-containing protein [Archaeoglobaceae archaeon]